MRRLFILGACAALAACSDSRFAERMLADQGYRDVQTNGHRLFNWCPKEDSYVTEFSATSPGGRRVTGVVCEAWPFGGGFVRLD